MKIRLVSISKVAELFNVSYPTVRNMINKGYIKGYKIAGVWRVDINSCYDYLNNHSGVDIYNQNKEDIKNE